MTTLYLYAGVVAFCFVTLSVLATEINSLADISQPVLYIIAVGLAALCYGIALIARR